MPKMQNAHIDRAMTNISVAYLQDASNFVADKVFPIVPVKRQSDVFYTYNKGDFMRDEAQLRGAASESAGGDYGVEASSPYYCRKHAFHKDVTPEERAFSRKDIYLCIYLMLIWMLQTSYHRRC